MGQSGTEGQVWAIWRRGGRLAGERLGFGLRRTPLHTVPGGWGWGQGQDRGWEQRWGQGWARGQGPVEELCVAGGAWRPQACAATSGLQQPPKGGPSAASSVPSCPVPLAAWGGVLEMRSEMVAGLPAARGDRREGARGLRWGQRGRGGGGAGAAQGPVRLRAAQGKVLGRWPAATERLAGFRRSWLSPCVSFGTGTSGLSAGNSRVAPAQSKQLTHLLLLPLRRETREDGKGGWPGGRLRSRPRQEPRSQGTPQRPGRRAQRGCQQLRHLPPGRPRPLCSPQPPAQLCPGSEARPAVGLGPAPLRSGFGADPHHGHGGLGHLPASHGGRGAASKVSTERDGFASPPTAMFPIKAPGGPCLFSDGAGSSLWAGQSDGDVRSP